MWRWRVEAKVDPNDTSAWVDLSDHVARVSIRRGGQSDQDVAQPGELVVELDNPDGRFTPENTQSPYTGRIVPNVEVRVGCMFWQGGLSQTLAGGSNPERVPLFCGHVVEWKPRWDGRRFGTVTLRAFDEFERLARVPYGPYGLRSHILSLEPDAFWPLQDDGAVAEDIVGGLDGAYHGSDSVITRQSESIVSQAGSAVQSTGGANWSAGHVVVPRGASLFDGTSVSVVLAFKGTGNVNNSECILLNVGRQPGRTAGRGRHWLQFRYDTGQATPTLYVEWKTSSKSVQPVASAVGGDGESHLLVAHVDWSARTVDIEFDATTDSGTWTSGDDPDSADRRLLTLCTVARLPDTGASTATTLTMSDVAVWKNVDVTGDAYLYQAFLNGHASEKAGAEITRLLTVAQSPLDSDLDTGATPLAAVDAETTVLDRLRAAALADYGTAYVTRHGRLKFVGRRDRWEERLQPSVVFGDQIGETGYDAVTFDFSLDRVWTRTAVDPKNTTDGRAVNTAAIDSYGDRTLSRSIVGNDQTVAQHYAEWLLAAADAPTLAIDRLQATVLTDREAWHAARMDPETFVRVYRRPSGSDTVNKRLRVVGIDHDLDAETRVWRMTLDTADGEEDLPMLLDDTTRGELDLFPVGF